MRNVKRIDKTLSKFKKLWKEVPDFRFWQVINALQLPEEYQNRDPFYFEESDWDKIFDYTYDMFSGKLDK